MKKILSAILATAAALSASAEEIELLTNGDGSTLNGWTVSSGNFSIQTDGSGVSWVASGSNYNVAYQTVTLADFGFSASDIANNPTMTASITVWSEYSGNRICNARVFQLDADGKTLETNTFVERAGWDSFAATNVTARFTINSQTRKLKYEFSGQDKDGWAGLYGPKFRNFSLTIGSPTINSQARLTNRKELANRSSDNLENGTIYDVSQNLTLSASAGSSMLRVLGSDVVAINVKRGVTLTVNGGNATETTGAGAAISVAPQATLYIVGEGTLIANGGNAANGGNGTGGGNAEAAHNRLKSGSGGNGGAGGGGAGAGIGGAGGGGAVAGSGASQPDWRETFHDDDFPADGEEGGAGEDGSDGDACGSVFILGDVTVRVNGGAAGSAGSAASRYGDYSMEEASDDWFAGGGGPGGAGGGGGAAMSIGGGGGGGGAGGGGGSGSFVVVDDWNDPDDLNLFIYDRSGDMVVNEWVIRGGGGGNGGGGMVGDAGAKTLGEASRGHDNWDEPWHSTSWSGKGGNGGNGGTQGGDGSLYALRPAGLSAYPSRTPAQPTPLQGQENVLTASTITFMSDGSAVRTEQTSLMFAPPEAPAVSKAGYAFAGYFTADGARVYDANYTCVHSVWPTVEDMTLHAKWGQIVAHVTFVSRSTEVGSGDYLRVDGALVPPAAPAQSRIGCRFLGFFTAETGGEQFYDENCAYMLSSTWEPTGDVTLYAHWAPVTLTFTSLGSTVGTGVYDISGETATPPEAPSVTMGGCRFLGYFTAATGGEQVYDETCAYVPGSSSTWRPTADATLYAHLEPVTVTFMSQGSTVGTDSYQISGNTVMPPAAPSTTRNYCRFLGYFTQETGGERVYDEARAYVLSPSSTWKPTDDVALYAQWTPVTITFKSEGATIGTRAYQQSGSSMVPPTAPPVSREGFRFAGYNLEDVRFYDENYRYVAGQRNLTQNFTLVAQWTKVVNFSFISTGTAIGTIEYANGDPAPTAPHASRSGDYTFLGYYTESGVQVYDADYQFMIEGTSVWSLSTNEKLYAHWAVPEGSVVKLVYRGQLNLLTGDPAVNDTTYTKKMHFRVYDGSEATTPLWQTGNEGVDVTVNADGSFVYSFGDDNLAALIATGRVTHVGLALGATASTAVEMKPRRELRPVAAVNRALTAEGAALDIRIGNLATENSLVAADATVSKLEVAGTVNAYGAGKVSVSPLTIGPAERTKLLRGKGVKVFSKAKPTVLSTPAGAILRGQELATAPSDGIALISSKATGNRALRCPAVIQYCREGEKVRAPTSDAGGLKVTFFPFIGKEGR